MCYDANKMAKQVSYSINAVNVMIEGDMENTVYTLYSPYSHLIFQKASKGTVMKYTFVNVELFSDLKLVIFRSMYTIQFNNDVVSEDNTYTTLDFQTEQLIRRIMYLSDAYTVTDSIELFIAHRDALKQRYVESISEALPCMDVAENIFMDSLASDMKCFSSITNIAEWKPLEAKFFVDYTESKVTMNNIVLRDLMYYFNVVYDDKRTRDVRTLFEDTRIENFITVE